MTGQGDAAIGAEVIEILGTLAVRGVLIEVEADFHARTALSFAAGYKSTNAQLIAISAGATADVAIMTRQGIDQLVGEGKIVAGSTADIAQSGVGIAVRAGAPKPDISTPQAFKRTLLAAKSIAFSRIGASGIHFAELIERLGIAAEIRRKATISDSYVGEFAARGDTELAVQQISELMPVAGIDIVGPLPGDLQKISVFSGGVFAAAKHAAGAARLIAYLASPELAPILARKGLSPP